MIQRLLIANRGEVARRVIHTCRRLGISSVAVFCDADADGAWLREADLAVRLPGGPGPEAYRRGDVLVHAARSTGADSVHPGYELLAEDASFARQVAAAGLTWVGSPPSVIATMGSKIAARLAMSTAGVPVLPRIDPDRVGMGDLPLIVKASSGGGGRGMRIVRSARDLRRAIDQTRAEAADEFGDPTVYCERYVHGARHVEVQVVADMHGAVWVAGERECSVQRRYQALIEEAPSPLVERTPGLRDRLLDVAVTATRAAGFVGVGTLEFLAEEDGTVWFLEMNTRLQVEHSVSECVTGVDLVVLQLQIADGEHLDPALPGAHGHAIQARLLAEDAASGWSREHGRIERFDVPLTDVTFAAPEHAPVSQVRVDSAIGSGPVDVASDDDPMLAKIVAWAPTRAAAIRRLATTLEATRVHGLTTNLGLLVRVLRHPTFRAGDADTSFLEAVDLQDLAGPLVSESKERVLAVAAAVADSAAARTGDTVDAALPASWRNVGAMTQTRQLAGQHGVHAVTYEPGRAATMLPEDELLVVSATPAEVVLRDVAGVVSTYHVERFGDQRAVWADGIGSTTLRALSRFAPREPAALPES